MKKQKGFTLLETLVALGLGVAVLVAAAGLLVDGNESRKVQKVASDLTSLAEGAYKWGTMRGNFTGLTCAIAQGYQTQVTTCTGTNPWGGDYLLAPGNSCTGGLATQICVSTTGLPIDVTNQVLARFNGVATTSYISPTNQPAVILAAP